MHRAKQSVIRAGAVRQRKSASAACDRGQCAAGDLVQRKGAAVYLEQCERHISDVVLLCVADARRSFIQDTDTPVALSRNESSHEKTVHSHVRPRWHFANFINCMFQRRPHLPLIPLLAVVAMLSLITMLHSISKKRRRGKLYLKQKAKAAIKNS